MNRPIVGSGVFVPLGVLLGLALACVAVLASTSVAAQSAITEDAGVEFSISGPSGEVEEGSDAEFTVTLSAGVASEVTVDWTASGASPGMDYSPTGGSVTFPGGSSAGATRTITISVTNDFISEVAETFTVTLGSVSGDNAAQVGVDPNRGSASATVAASDPITVALSGPATVVEGGTASYAVSLSPAGVVPSADLTVDYATSDGTASAGEDYEAVSGALTFTRDSSGPQTFTVAAAEGKGGEAGETFTVSLSNAAGGGGATPIITGSPVATAITAITEDAGVEFSISGPSGEVEEGSDAEFTVTLSAGVASEVTVDWTASGASPGMDYSPTGGSVTFPGGSSAGATRTITISVTNDFISEVAETFTVTLGSVSGDNAAQVGVDPNRGSASATVAASDPITVALSGPATVVEGGTASYAVSLSPAGVVPSADLTVDYATSDGTASAGEDYEAVSGALTFTRDSSGPQTFTVAAAEGKGGEAGETFTVSLSNAAGGGGATPIITGSPVATAITAITEDAGVEFSISGPSGEVEEGSDAEFTVTLSAGVASEVTVDWTASGASPGMDYSPTGGSVTFPGGSSAGATRTITISVTNDFISEVAETFTVTLGSVSGDNAAQVGVDPNRGSASATVAASDPITVALSGPATVVEGGTASYAVSLSPAGVVPSADLTVDYATSDGTASAGEDYEAVSGALTFTRDSSGPQTFTVAAAEGKGGEAGETFTVSLSNAAGGGGATPIITGSPVATAITAITEDAGVEFSISGPSGEVEEGSDAEFTVTLSAGVASEVTVDWTASGASPGMDYSPTGGSVTFPGGSSAGATRTITISVTNDFISEVAETFTVTLGSVSGDNAAQVGVDPNRGSASATVAASDPITVALSGPATVVEGGTASYAVSLSPAGVVPSADLTVDYATSDGTASAGEDYEAVSGALTFTRDSSGPQTFTVAAAEGKGGEAGETFTVSLSNAAGGGGATPIITGSPVATAITQEPSRFRQSSGATGVVLSASPEIPEESTDEVTVTFTATLQGGVATKLIRMPVVPLAVFPQEQEGFTDTASYRRGSVVDLTFTTSFPDIEIAPGQSSASGQVGVTTTNDNLLEGDEIMHFVLVFSDRADELPTTPAFITIKDDERGTVSISGPAGEVEEGDVAEFTVTLSHSVTQELTVAWTAGGAGGAADYSPADGTVTFPAGSAAGATQTIAVTVTDDNVSESAETFTVSLGAAEAPYTDNVSADPNRGSAEATIAPSDRIVVVLLAEHVQNEGDKTVEYYVHLLSEDGRGLEATIPSADLTVTVSTTDGTATAGEDYTGISHTFLFTPDSSDNQSNSIRIFSDEVYEPRETFTLSIDSVTGGGGPAPRLANSPIEFVLIDPDAPTTVHFVTHFFVSLPVSIPYLTSAREGDGSGTLRIIGLEYGRPMGSEFDVTLSLGGSATAGEDYDADSLAPVRFDGAGSGFDSSVDAGKSAAFSITDDAVVEVDETVFVQGNADGVVFSSDTIIIADNDTATLSISAPAASVDEGENAEFTVTLSTEVARDVGVAWSASGASPGDDYSPSRGTVTFPAGSAAGATQTMAIPVTVDDLVEAEETFTVTLGEVIGVLADRVSVDPANAEATATLVSENTGTLSISGPSGNVDEGEDAEFTVTLSAEVASEVTVDWSASGASAGTDYSPSSGTVTFPKGSAAGATQTIAIAVADDDLHEPAGSVTVTLGAVGGDLARFISVDQGSGSASAAIAPSDPITVALSGPATVTEGDSATYTVSLSPTGVIPLADLTVDYETAAGSATAGEDYTTASGTLTFTPTSAGHRTITVTTIEDTADGSDETFTLSLSNAAGGGGPAPNIGGSPVTTTIEDDDDPPTGVVLSVSESRVAEDAAATEVTVTATLQGTNLLESDSSVWLDLVGPARGGGSDYTASPSRPADITIPAGQRSGTSSFTLTPTDDAQVGGDKLIVVWGRHSGRLEMTGAIITIVEDDSATLAISGPSGNVDEGEDAEFTVTLSAEVRSDVRVDWSASGASPGDDYSPSSGIVTFPSRSAAGSTQTITIAVADDTLYEGAETITVTLGRARGYLADHVSSAQGKGSATATIAPSEPLTVTLSGPATVSEGDSASYVVSLSPVGITLGADLTVEYAVAAGSAAAGVDFATASGTLTFTEGNPSSQTVTVSTIEDSLDESDETLTFSLSNAVGGGGPAPIISGSPVTTTIDDDDAAPGGIVLSVSPSRVVEGQAGEDQILEFELTATLQGNSVLEADSTVSYRTGPFSGVITIGAGQSSGTGRFYYVVGLDDNVVQKDSKAVISGTHSGGLTVSPATITFADNDTATLSLSGPTGSAAEGEYLVFKVTLSAPAALAVSVGWTASGASPGVDYSPSSGTLEFYPGNRTRYISIAVTDDNISEAAETVTVSLGNVSGDLADRVSVDQNAASVSATIAASDPISVRLAQGDLIVEDDGFYEVLTPRQVEEGDSIEFLVYLLPYGIVPSADLTVDYATSNGTAIAGQDYTAVAGTLTFTPAASGIQTVRVSTIQDLIPDNGETFTLSLSNAAGGGGAATPPFIGSQTTATIRDGDVTPSRIHLSASESSVAENANATVVTVTATLNGNSALMTDSTVDLVLRGNAKSGSDYSVNSLPAIAIPAGQNSATASFTLTPTDNALLEGDKRIGVEGTHSGNLVVIPAAITLSEDDGAEVSIAGPTVEVDEGSDAVFIVTLSTEVADKVGVLWYASGASPGADYGPAGGVVTFPAGSAAGATQTITLPVTDDSLSESAETFEVILDHATGALARYVTLEQGKDSATATIAASDRITVVVTGLDRVEEGDNVIYTVSLSPSGVTPSADLTVNYATSDGTATAGQDYTAASGTLTFTRYNTGSQRVGVTTLEDDADESDESFTLTLSNAVGSGGPTPAISGSPATISITDDDVPQVTVVFGEISYTVAEGGSVTVKVTLSADPERTVVIPVSAANQGGASNSDYSGVPSIVTFDSGETEQSISFTATQDSVDDDGESVKLAFGMLPERVNEGSPNEATVAITDDDVPQVAVMFGESSYTVAEGGSVTVKLTLSADPERTVTIPLSAANQGGAEDADYSAVSDSVTFNSGDTEMSFSFTATQDNEDDDGESVKLAFGTMPAGVSEGSPNEATVSITDDDATLFDPGASYRILTAYHGSTAIELSAYLTDGVTGVTFALDSCDDSRGDYYDSAAVANGELRLTPNTLGHVHGTNTQKETVCTVTATGAGGSEAREFRLYTVSDRTPRSLAAGELILIDARSDELDIRLDLSGAARERVRLVWRIAGGDSDSRVASGVTRDTVLTIPGLSAGTEYEVSAYLMTGQSFDLFRAGNTGPEGTLLAEGTWDAKWLRNLTNSGLGKSQATTTARTAYGVAISIGDARASEGAGSISFDVTLDRASGNIVTVDWSTSDGTAEAPVDYKATTSGQLTFAAGETQKTLEVMLVDDVVDEAEEETFTVTLSNVVNADLAVASATGTINDDDDPPVTVSFESDSYMVAEGSSVTVKVTLSADPERSVTISLSAANQGGASSGDYSGVPTSVTFSSGETEQSFTFAAAQDDIDDDNETVGLSFGSLPSRVTAGTNSAATVSITDDDDPRVTVSFESATYTVAEGESVTVKVTLSADPERSVTVPVEATPGNGATTDDYSGVPTSVTFNSGDTEKAFTFRATQDDIDDDDESVDLAFGSLPDRVTAGTNSAATVAITDDDDPRVTVSFESATYTVAEGESVTVKVTLSADPERSVTVPVEATPGNGATTDDYSGVPTSVTFQSGDTEKAFTFRATQDDIDDDDESVDLAFGSLPSRVTAGTNSAATVAITDDDDPRVTVSFESATYTVAEGESVTVKVTLSADPERTVEIPISATDGNGATSADYSGVPSSVRFNSGETEKTFSITATQDNVDDDGETVGLSFGTMPAGVSEGSTNETTVAINDDDVPQVTVVFGESSYTVAEGSSVEVKVTLSADPERTVEIPISATDGNGATSADYSGVPTSVTFSSGETEQSFTFAAAQDDIDDDNETVGLSFGSLPSRVTAGTNSAATVSITDDDDPRVTVSFESATYTVAEGESVTVKVTLSADPERSVTVPVEATPGNGATTDDYSGVPTSVTFNSGDTEKAFTFRATQDDIDDDDESVDLAFGSLPDRVTAGTNSAATVAITDDDDPRVTVSFESATYTVAEGESVTVKVTLSADPERSVTVPVEATPGNGATTDDYSGVPTSVTFQSGDTEKAFTFRATQDDIDDDDESVDLAFGSLPDRVTAGTNSAATVAITDDDDPRVTVSFGQASYTVAEGSSVEVKVTLSVDPERSVTVPLVTTNSDGAISADYSGVPTSVTFQSGDTEQSFSISATQDTVDDDDESVDLSFGTLPARVSAGTTDQATVTITDDDDPPVTVSFGQASYTVAEGDSVTVKATLSADPERTVEIPVSATPGNGATSADYSGIPSTVTFNSGDTEETFTFRATQDTVDDDDESVDLSFGTLPARVSAGSTDQATVTITDDDDPRVSVSFGESSYTVAEGDTVQVKVTLSADPERAVEIPISATPGNGATTADYSGVPSSVTFNAGEQEQSFSISATQDTADDDGESVDLSFGSLPAGVSAGSTDQATVSITDDDDPSVAVSFEQASYTVAEGSMVTVKVTLSADPERSVTVPVETSNNGGATSADYSGVPTSVTFNRGDTEKAFTFSATQDDIDDDEESVDLSFGTLPARVSAGSTDQATVSITDDDDPRVTVSFESDSYTVAEGSSVTVKVKLSADPERSVTVPLMATDGNGASAADYSGVPTSVTFNSGDMEKSFSFTATQDDIDDDNETVGLSFGSLPSRVTAGTNSETTVSITDDDVPQVTVSFESDSYTVAEGDSVQVKVTLSADPERSVTVPLVTTNSDGAISADYSGVPTSVTFNAGDTEKAFTFSATQDDIDDDDESVDLAFGTLPARVSAGSTDQATVSITDDDDPRVTVSFESDSYTVAEGSSVTVKVKLSADPERSVTVPLMATDGNGASADDYSGVPTSVTFNSGDMEKSFSFTATQDDIDDDNETVGLSFGTLPSRVTAGTNSTAPVTITDDDDPPVTVSFGQASYTVAEGSMVTVKVTLSADPERSVTVPVEATPGNGATTADYSGVPTSVTFSSGETEQSFTFAAAQDDIDDDNETVGLSFGSLPDRVTAGTNSTATVTIADDDDPRVTVSFESASYTVAEGESVTVKVKLSADPERSVTVPVMAADGNGATTADYSGVPTSVTFNSGDTEKAFTFSATQDTVDDDGETVGLSFGTLPSRVTAGTNSTAPVTITDDDDPPVTVSFGQASYTVAEGSMVTVKVTLSADPERSVTVPVEATPGNGATTADYSGVPTSVTFSSGETEQSFTFAAAQDDIDDDDESVDLSFGTLPARVSAGSTDQATVAITDDDDPPVTVGFEQASYTVAEGSSVTVKVKLSADPERSVTVPLMAADGNGATTADYSGVPTSVTFQSGDTEKAFTFMATQDTVDDDGETVGLSFGTLPSRVTAGTNSTATVAITDDDDPPVTVSFGETSYTVGEGDSVQVKVTLSADPERSLEIPVSAAPGNGATTDDYSGVPTSVTFSSGETEQSFTFAATQDDIDDDDESVDLTFGALPDRVTAGANSTATVTITDDDDPPVTVSFGQASYIVAEGSMVTVKVTLSADPERSVTVPVETSNNGGASASDYSGVPTSVTFNAGDTEQSFTFAATQDDIDDDNETVGLSFGNLPDRVTAGTNSTATVSITDDDDPRVTVSFGQASYTVAEGSMVTVKVTLSADPERTVEIPVSTTPGNGATTADYTGVPTSVTFSSGDTEQSFSISATQDTADDDDESVDLAFGTLPARVSAGSTDQATVSITDDDVPPVTVSFGQASYTVAEGESVTVKVTLSADPERSVTVPVETSNNGGASASDYSGVPTSVTFDSGETEQSFTFAAAQDDIDDDNETVGLSFGNLPSRVTAGTTSEATVTITDDDVPSVSVSFGQASYTVAEGSMVTVKVTLSADPERTVEIPVSATPGNGATTADYSGVPSSVTFQSGDTEETFTFSATQDTVDDDGETVGLSFGTLPDRVTEGTNSTATVAIADDDDPRVTVSFEQASYTVAEGSMVTVKVTLSAAPERTVYILISTAPGGRATTADFSGIPVRVAFQSGDTEQSFTITASQDTVDDDGERVGLGFGMLPSRVTAGTNNSTTVFIMDDDDPPVTVSFEQASYTVGEGDTVEVKVTLSADPERTVEIPISATPGNGATTADYSGVPSSVTFISGDTEESFTFRAVQDTVDDDNETVELSFGTLPSRVTAGTNSTATVSITDDDDPPVTVSFGESSYTVAEGSGVEVKVTLSADPERSVTVPVMAADGNGATTADYSGVPSSVTFNSGDMEQSFTITATQDTVDDDSETVGLSFGTLPSRVTAGTNRTATVTIVDDDDPQVTVSFGQASYTVAEGDSVQVKVTLSADPERTVEIPIAATPGNGATTADYSGVPSSVTFNAGEQEQSFSFSATQDTVDDDSETVGLSFGTLPDRVTARTPSEATVSITDDDDPSVTVSFEQASYTVGEGNTVQVKVTLSADPERTVEIPISATDGNGATTDDYSGVPSSVTFSSGETEKAFTFSATQDDIDDDDESVDLNFGTLPAGVSAGSTDQATVTIADDDDPSVTVSFGESSYTVAEGDSVTVKVTLSADPERSVTLPVETSNIGGASASDYSGVPSSVTFSSGDTEQSFSISATQDMVDDDDETVELSFGALPSGVSAGTTDQATVSITDDDVPSVSVSFESDSYTVAEGDTVQVKVTLSVDPERSVTVPLMATDGNGATTGDYSELPTSVTFQSGEQEKSFGITATQDDIDDDNETVELSFGTLPAGVSAGSPATAMVSITDDDVPSVSVSFESDSYTVAEGDTVQVKVTLSVDPERSVTVPLMATDGNGATTGDYSELPTSVTFQSGEQEKSIGITATQDDIDDDNETVELSFGTLPAGVSAGSPATAMVSITDDDAPQVTVSFEQASYTVKEGDSVTVKVTLSADPERAVTVPVTATPGNGATSADYSGVPASVRFTRGDTEESFTITATQDTLDDDGGTVELRFGTLPVGMSSGTNGRATVSIIDDDPQERISISRPSPTPSDDDSPQVTVSFEQSSYTVAEGNSVMVKVTLSADPERTVEIPVSATNRNGATAADYTVAPTTLSFDSGDTEQMISFTATQDEVNDDGEAVDLGFGTLPDGVTAGTNSQSTVSITDDDDPQVSIYTTGSSPAPSGANAPEVSVEFERATYKVREGNSVSVKVRLSADPERTVTVQVTATNGNGASRDDYSMVPASVAFTSGDTEQMISFTATQDEVDDDGETVVLGFGTLPDGVISGSTGQATVYIMDDDSPQVTVSFEQDSVKVAEGDSVMLKVKLSADPERRVDIPISTNNRNGASEADYGVAPGTISFEDGETEESISFTAVQDTVNDDGEAVELEFGMLPDGVSAGTNSQATVYIMDDDSPQVTVSFEQDFVKVAEGDSVMLKVKLSADPERRVDIPISTNNRNGASEADYGVAPGTISFEDGETEESISFTAVQDTVDDDGEAVELAFGMLPDGVSAGTNSQATVSIIDDDESIPPPGPDDSPQVTVSFEQDFVKVAEGDSVMLKVKLSADPERRVDIPISTNNRNGASEADYGVAPGTISFEDGETEESISFTATQDTVNDDGEAVELAFGMLPDGVSAGTYSQATVSIIDDEEPSPPPPPTGDGDLQVIASIAPVPQDVPEPTPTTPSPADPADNPIQVASQDTGLPIWMWIAIVIFLILASLSAAILIMKFRQERIGNR